MNDSLNGHAPSRLLELPERPPHNDDAERYVLGSMLRDNGVIPVVGQLLRPENFYGHANQKIFKAIVDLHGDGKPVDAVILADCLKQRGQTQDAKYADIGAILDEAPTAANAEHYAKIVQNHALQRDTINALERTLYEARNPSCLMPELLDRAEREFAALRSAGSNLPGRRYTFDAMSSPTFFAASYKLQWLVKRLLVKDQPGVLGGPKKALKTTLLLDLGVSLATGTPFLGYFDVYRPCRVLMISGESGEAVLQETGRRICAARSIDPASLDLHWSFKLPQLANPLDRDCLAKGLKNLGAEVLIIDPIYLCMLAGLDGRSVDAGNFFQMGPLLLDITRACLDSGCTPIFAHHTPEGKTRERGKEPMELGDLAYSGFGEFARQWVLINRREAFNAETGSSRLWLSAGGSAGQSGVWAVDTEEGVLGDDFSGRKWEVTVSTGRSGREATAEAIEAAKEQEKLKREKAEDAKVLLAIDKLTAAKKSGETAPTKCQFAPRQVFQTTRRRLPCCDLWAKESSRKRQWKH